MTDVDELRARILAAHPLSGTDRHYAFYYDETNNVRKLHIANGVLNVPHAECFVLGGIVRCGPAQPIDLGSLRRALRLQPGVREIKLRHLGSGSFLELLESTRLATLLGWLDEQGFLIHYQVTDLLYFSVVDIVDSILAATGEQALFAFHPQLKDGLYALLREDISDTIELFGRHHYPNVGERSAALIRDLLDRLETRGERLDHFPRHLLKGLLQLGRNADELPFLENEEPHVLVREFGSFVVNRLCLFKQSEHVLDEEPVMEQFLERTALTDGGSPFRNYRFADSRIEPGIQLSDVVAGLLGKMFDYVNRASLPEIDRRLGRLTARQRRTLGLLAALLDRSTEECEGFAQYVISLEDQARAALLLGPQ